MSKLILSIFILIFLFSCGGEKNSRIAEQTTTIEKEQATGVELLVLGIAQDAGFPQVACAKSCCKAVWKDQSLRRMVSCLGVVDNERNSAWLFDATPDFKDQLELLTANAELAGIFLTHGHIGHYTGLMQLGREAMGAKNVPVYAMPRMDRFLRSSGPWSQLVRLDNIELQPMLADSVVALNNALSVRPLLVPHRDEFTETVGFLIQGPQKTALFIPDIDKWAKWERSIADLIQQVDYAFLDGTFYQNGELPGRDMSQIPHPFVEESIALFRDLPANEKAKIHFIHFNHTNPLLNDHSKERAEVLEAGFQVAQEGMRLTL